MLLTKAKRVLPCRQVYLPSCNASGQREDVVNGGLFVATVGTAGICFQFPAS